MSTRSVVARVKGDGFAGRYCHWDGYPTHRGAQLFQSYRELGSADALIKYAIREGESGYWSSFCVPSENRIEADRTTPEGEKAFQENPAKIGWAYEASQSELITSSGDDCGTEWAYVIADNGLTVFENRRGWQYIGTYKWDEEPEWESVERANWSAEDLASLND